MATTFRGKIATGDVAIFDEPSTSGGVFDIDAPRNAPLKLPEANLSAVRFHVDFDYYQVAVGPTSVVVSHAAVTTATTTVVSFWGGTGVITRVGQVVTTHIDLVTHALGYVPKYMVVSGGEIIAPGTLVQNTSAGARVVTPYATTTKVRLMDVGFSGASDLPSLSKTYEVLVFRAPAESGDQLFNFDPATGRVVLGFEKFDSALKMLRQAAPGDSAFDISLGPTVKIRNGGARTVLANGTTITEVLYSGGFTGSPSIQCAVD